MPSKAPKSTTAITVLTAVTDDEAAADKAALLARALAYEPKLDQRGLSQAQWDKYAPVLRARAAAGADNLSQVRAMLGNALTLLAWALANRVPLTDDLDKLWLDTTQGRFLKHLEGEGTSKSSLATVRMHLRRMAEADSAAIDTAAETALDEEIEESGFTVLDSRDAVEVDGFGLTDAEVYWALLALIGEQVRVALPGATTPRSQTPGRDTVVPYGAAEVSRLMRAVLAVRVATTRRALRAEFALGLGAGLEGMSLALAKPEDVHPGGTVVDVRGSNDKVIRTAPVLSPFSSMLVALAQEAGDARLLGGDNSTGKARRNRPATLAARLRARDPHAVRLDTTRLKATWVVLHLACGTPLPTLLPLAGLTTAAGLDSLLPYVPTVPNDLLRPWAGLELPGVSS